ncbi:winged helix-turn-helix domain-containing protein [soil metagenome]
MPTLTVSQARRMALAAQGFTDPRPAGRVDVRHLRRVVDRVGVLQIDSVNVVARAHELSLFSRLGPYSRDLLPDFVYRRKQLFEGWAHVASYVPTAWHPLFRHDMRDWRGRIAEGEFVKEHPGYLEAVLEEVAAHGPLLASELRDPGQKAGPWWGWAKGKTALELLFLRGDLAVAGRRNFARVYDLAEHVIPAEILAQPTPSREEAERELLVHAARACGVGTAADLVDYYRLRALRARPLLADLVRDGRLLHAEVRGWSEPAFAHPEAQLPRWVRAAALLSPFDPVVWFRPRAYALFDFHYRIEIYVPADKRRYGYYVFPFLLGDRIVARVDLKADRASGRLLVRGAFAEEHADLAMTAAGLAGELWRMADWLALDDVAVAPNGDLARPLAAAVADPQAQTGSAAL